MTARWLALSIALLLPGQAPATDAETCFSENAARNARCIGVALAGGGTKSASVAMGVLTGLAESGMLEKVDAISSVSGGTYAAYFYFSKLRELQRNPAAAGKDLDSPAAFFRDCIPREFYDRGEGRERVFSDALWNQLTGPEHTAEIGTRLCPARAAGPEPAASFQPYRFQTHVRCHQDVFEAGECRFLTTAEESAPLSGGLPALGATFLTLAPLSATLWPLFSVHHISRTLFDWPVNTSPLRIAYRNGLGATFGLYPTAATLSEERQPCDNSAYSNCAPGALESVVDEDSFTLRDLRGLRETGVQFSNGREPLKAPLWFINSTATPSRSIFGWATSSTVHARRDAFEINPYGFGSEFYGRDPAQPYLDRMQERSVLDAVNVSAAFLDSNLQSVEQPYRFGAAVGLHLLNSSWGLDIPNPNVSDGRRVVHSLLPFPFYYMDGFVAKLGGRSVQPTFGTDTKVDSAWIRLIDGGQSENLGAYALIRRGYGYVLIADGAQDRKGSMQDVCNLRLQLLEHHGWQLVIPGLEELDKVCRQWANQIASRDVAGASTRNVRDLYECSADESIETCQARPPPQLHGYHIRNWTQPFLVGCVLNHLGSEATPRKADPDRCADADARRSWIILVKPAYNVGEFEQQLDAGKTRIERCGGERELPCEASAYLARNPKAREKASTAAAFPQHSTALMTLDSDYTRYGAYKDLLRSHTVSAFKAIRGGDEGPSDARLLDILREQKRNPVPPYTRLPTEALPESK